MTLPWETVENESDSGKSDPVISYPTTASENSSPEENRERERAILRRQGLRGPIIQDRIDFRTIDNEFVIREARQNAREYKGDTDGIAPEVSNNYDEVEEFYEENIVLQTDDDFFEPMARDFKWTGLDERMTNNAKYLLHINKLNTLQSRAIPIILSARNLLVQAPTGIGKTAAFMMPAIQMIVNWKKENPHPPSTILPSPRVLILNNTRLLADQTYQRSRRLIGIGSTSPNVKLMNEVQLDCYTSSARFQPKPVCDIAVGTMGTIRDKLDRKEISFDNLKLLIVDEADRMTDLDFGNQVERIFEELPEETREDLQVALFSATYQNIGDQILLNPVQKKLFGDRGCDGIIIPAMPGHINQRVIKVTSSMNSLAELDVVKRVNIVKALIDEDLKRTECSKDGPFKETIGVFVETTKKVNVVAMMLQLAGYKFVPLSSKIEKSQQQLNILDLKNCRVQGVVTTNIMARGTDVASIKHVIIMEMSDDFSLYKHRIGRTGRAGHGGTATVIMNPDSYRIHHQYIPVELHNFLDEHMQPIPEWLTKLHDDIVAMRAQYNS